MKVDHIRTANVKRGSREYCISHIYINGVYSHDSIEDYDRGLDEKMSLAQIVSRKIANRTAIPTGHYTVKMNVVSPTFSKKEYYRSFCNGILPRLDPVKGFSGILIHRGVNEDSSSGCIIVGRNKKVGEVTESRETFERIYRLFLEAYRKGERIDYIITRK